VKINLIFIKELADIPEHFVLKKYVEGKKYQELVFCFEDTEIHLDAFLNGKIYRLVYMEFGEKHRFEEEGPAYQEWDEEGNLLYQIFYEDGVCLRENHMFAKM
jgi:hypothetical protein